MCCFISVSGWVQTLSSHLVRQRLHLVRLKRALLGMIPEELDNGGFLTRSSQFLDSNHSHFLGIFPLDSHIGVSFLSWGYPQSSSILDWDVPEQKPSSYWGTPMTMETDQILPCGCVVDEESRCWSILMMMMVMMMMMMTSSSFRKGCEKGVR